LTELPGHSLLPHARCIVRDHLQIHPGEDLLILWDETVTQALHDALRDAAALLDVRPVTLVYEPLAYRPINEYGLFAGRSLKEPLLLPPILKTAIGASTAFILLCSDTELLFSPDLKEALATGTRGLFIPYMHSIHAHRMLFTTSEQVLVQAKLIQTVGETLEGRQEVHVTSNEGTNLRLTLGQYQVLRRTGIVNRGELLFLPPGNVARVPDDGSAEGVLVIDRTVCANDYKELKEPIMLRVSQGEVVAIEGGMEAKLLREFLASLNDRRAYHLTELAIGTNPLCRFSGIGAPSEDTHKLGTVAFALGCDTHVGGATRGPVHIDMTMRFPSIRIGATQVVSDGQLLIGDSFITT
jgi:2,5-dihydroxypyridine 5,6-dioxygenase